MGRLIAIVGRPNVGKSTLFNRLTKSRAAIVDDVSGTTRDRQYGMTEWNGMKMSVVDTGGWVVNSEDIFEGEINKQVNLAIDEADVILFVVDLKNGITDLDDHVADILRRCNKPVIVVTNKDDNNEGMYSEGEFYSLRARQTFLYLGNHGNRALATCLTKWSRNAVGRHRQTRGEHPALCHRRTP
jgi:GTP-binding protein